MTSIGPAMRRLMPFLLALMLALTPGFAQARPGLGGSMGSRGSATWSTPSGAAPLQRSMTPNYGTPGYGGYSNYGGYGGYRSSFGHGLLGGFLGAGLFGMMLGRGFFGFHSGFGFLGLLVQLTVLFFVGRWLLSRFFGAPAFAGAGGMFARGGFMQPGPAGARPSGGMGGGSVGGGGARRPLTVTQADYQQFTQLLMAVQGAWSRQDLTGLQAMATPEMVGYFNEQLSDLASRGARNEVRDVRLLQGDLSEAWSETGRDYATVSLKFSIIDVTFDRAGNVVDGSPTERVTVTEFWTFVRRLPGHWILSAIQQAR